MPWSQTGATQYQAQLGLLDKGRAIKALVDLLNGLALGCGIKNCLTLPYERKRQKINGYHQH